MGKLWDALDCLCPGLALLFASSGSSGTEATDSSAKEPLLTESKENTKNQGKDNNIHTLVDNQDTTSKPSYYQEPLLVAKVTIETEDGNWDKLATLASPSNWHRINRSDVNLALPVDMMDFSPTLSVPELNNPFQTTLERTPRPRKKAKVRIEEQDEDIDGDCEADDEENDAPSDMSLPESARHLQNLQMQLPDVKIQQNATFSGTLRKARTASTRQATKPICRKKQSLDSGTHKMTKSKTASSISTATKSAEEKLEESNPRSEKIQLIDPILKSRYKGKSFSHLFALGEQIGYGSTARVFKCRRKRRMAPERTSNSPLLNSISPVSSPSSGVSGGFGNIYAVKVIDKKKLLNFSGNPRKGSSLLEQFKQEIEILDKLRHPHIIRLFGMFESESNLHVVTEYCEGKELFDYVTSLPFGHASEHHAKQLVRQVTSAVAYMHSRGIIHRDIKLENILLLRKPNGISSNSNDPHVRQLENGNVRRLGDDPQVRQLGEDDITLKIIDFGLAKQTGFMVSKYSLENRRNESAKGRARTFFGTMGYLAPEMFLCKTYNHSVDVWALGVLTYVLLTGTFPFDDSPGKIQALRANRSRVKEVYKLRFLKSRSRKVFLSPQARDFVGKLLTIQPNERMEASEALEHEWLCLSE